ncbi:hypothetical protein BP5796_02806 [Coleophoma crateriformis]|uniref:CN hydrolase domain-containing protein n=1 Tax=Coleophoma crateriformis TaxID=565419 RepID=A0A3D8SZP2_9HELO|nr:hypothetical protein BP5796_02806 [Coleophoma crateriformis]
MLEDMLCTNDIAPNASNAPFPRTQLHQKTIFMPDLSLTNGPLVSSGTRDLDEPSTYQNICSSLPSYWIQVLPTFKNVPNVLTNKVMSTVRSALKTNFKFYAVSLGEQVHIAAWPPLYPNAATLKYPDPYTNISDANSDIVTPAYAIETATFTLAPFQTISAEGIRLNTPPGKELEDPNIYNGHSRIFGPDGQNLVAHPAKDFNGLLFIDLDETHLSKALNDFGGHYMRPDLIRLLVDTDRKDLVVREDKQTGGIKVVKTADRVGLSTPLAALEREESL